MADDFSERDDAIGYQFRVLVAHCDLFTLRVHFTGAPSKVASIEAFYARAGIGLDLGISRFYLGAVGCCWQRIFGSEIPGIKGLLFFIKVQANE